MSEYSYEIGNYYSGPAENIMIFCKSLDISEDRLATVSPVKIEQYQRIVDDAIDGYLCEYYFIPLTPYNQAMPDGSVRKVFLEKSAFWQFNGRLDLFYSRNSRIWNQICTKPE